MPEEETGQYGTFLRAMPAAHTYLGDVRDLPGNSDIRYELSSSGGPIRCNLPLLPIPYQCLFPGDTLPLMVPSDDPLTRRVVHRAMAAPPPLKGLFCALTFVPEMFDMAVEDPESVVGTVMEIRQMDDAREDSPLSVVSRGILRLRVVDLDWLTQLARAPPDMRHIGVRAATSVDVECDILPEETFPRQHGLPKNAFARSHRSLALTPHSAAVYRAFDANLLAERVRRSAFIALTVRDVEALPKDPESLSNAVASRLPLDATQRWRLLSSNSTVERLKLVLDFLKESASCDLLLTCARCGVGLAKMSDIVLVSDAGATGSFVNPGGAVHDMITVSGASAGPKLRLHGTPSSEHSWFPGYQWTIASCGTCGTHMGWRFTPEPDETNAEEAAALDAFVEVNERLPVAARRFADESSRHAMDTARTMGGRREAEFYGILRRATVAAEEDQGPGPRLQVRRVRDDVVIAFDDGDEDDDDEFEIVDDGSDDVGDADDDEVSVD